MPATDAELVASALKGDSTAFAEIIKRYQRLVFNIVYHYLGRREPVEDLAQEVFLKVYRSLDRYDPQRPLRHWIGKITANQCLDALRKRKTRRTDVMSDLSEDEQGRIWRHYEMSSQGRQMAEDQAERCFAMLQQAMEGLGEKDRMAFVLRELDDMPYAEVAAMLNSSEVAARIRVSRARKTIRQRLGRMIDAE